MDVELKIGRVFRHGLEALKNCVAILHNRTCHKIDSKVDLELCDT